tara:strand:- start:1152 stop:1619 length:468 start_codon:yes stop_codon:yes gene_type:complete
MELLDFSEACHTAREQRQQLTYRNRHKLRMKQTLPSVLPNILIMNIIKLADGGLATHEKKFQSCLLDIKQMVRVGHSLHILDPETGELKKLPDAEGGRKLRPRKTAIKFFHSFPENEELLDAYEQWSFDYHLERTHMTTNADQCWEPVFPVWEYY